MSLSEELEKSHKDQAAQISNLQTDLRSCKLLLAWCHSQLVQIDPLPIEGIDLIVEMVAKLEE